MIFLRVKPLFVAIALMVAAKVLADDAHSKSAITNSKARVIAPISILNTDGQGLDFGVIALGTTNSVVVVSASATVVANVSSGNAVIVLSTPQKAAKFTVSGEAEKTYSITLPESATIVNGTNSITISNFSSSNGAVGTIGTNGNDMFYVGGELTVPSDAIPAVYQGTFNVTVAYN